MQPLLCIFKSTIGYIILLFVSTNLIGLFVRGLVPSYYLDENKTIQPVEDITSTRSRMLTAAALLFCIMYLYSLYHFWNVSLSAAGLMIMLARIPDLLYEIRTGRKVNYKYMNKKPIDHLTTILIWAALPLIWFSLCN